MKRIAYAALLVLVLAVLVPAQLPARAATAPEAAVNSQYILNRYGYAVVNETVTFTNTVNSTATVPDFTVGIGNLSAMAVSDNVTGTGFKLAAGTPVGGPYTVLGGQSLAYKATLVFTLKVLLNGVVSDAKNGTIQVQVLVRPQLNLTIQSLKEYVQMPINTTLASLPKSLEASTSSDETTYEFTFANLVTTSVVTQLKSVVKSTSEDFHPLTVYQETRTVSVGSGGTPLVTDSITFENDGTTALTWIYVAPLVGSGGKVTVIPPPVPHLLNPAATTLVGFGIDLATNPAVATTISPNDNFTLTYSYSLPAKYYSSSGGVITVSMPSSAPIPAFANSFAVQFQLPSGYRVVQGPPASVSNVAPISWAKGSTEMSYALNGGWAVGAGIPAASAIFVLLLLGLFVSRTSATEEEETEEESSTERASAMIKAFDDKTNLINSIWTEVASAEPTELNKAHFDEIRGRLDSFRSKALQRLNEMKQKSTTQRFFELLNQMHTTEREVDRAAKDKLNLYEQYYTKRMGKEVYDRLLPQYSKRLEKALNDLSDELHAVQREAKLL